jgi:hypothetical protein
MYRIAHYSFLAAAATAPLGLLVHEWRVPTITLLGMSIAFAGIGYVRQRSSVE